jgi:hypothetical protein
VHCFSPLLLTVSINVYVAKIYNICLNCFSGWYVLGEYKEKQFLIMQCDICCVITFVISVMSVTLFSLEISVISVALLALQ